MATALAILRCLSGWVSVTFVRCVKTAKGLECAKEIVPKLSNGAISNDLKAPAHTGDKAEFNTVALAPYTLLLST